MRRTIDFRFSVLYTLFDIGKPLSRALIVIELVLKQVKFAY